MEHVDIRDFNEITIKLGERSRELDSLISEIPTLARLALGDNAKLSMDKLTMMGHGFGATTAIYYASRDPRVRRVVSYDPYLIPLEGQIKEGNI